MLIGTAQQIERLNGALVVGVVATFAALVVAGLPLIQPALLAHASPAEVLPSVPVLVLALVFHNVVPTICYGLGCDLPKIRSAIIFGSALPFAMFVAWDAVILGLTPWEAAAMAGATGEIFDPLLALRNSGGAFAELRFGRRRLSLLERSVAEIDLSGVNVGDGGACVVAAVAVLFGRA